MSAKKQGQPWLLLLEIIVIGAVLYKDKKLLKKITKQQDKRSLIKTSDIHMVIKKVLSQKRVVCCLS